MEKKEESASKLCPMCSQFYGTIATNYLCSSCFK